MKNFFPTLIARWNKRWQQQDMSYRLREIFNQALGYLILTLVTLGGAGVAAMSYLPIEVAYPCINFLASIYTLILLISTARAFDANHTRYLLDKLEDMDLRIHQLNEKVGNE
jgi:hypothetical protein